MKTKIEKKFRFTYENLGQGAYELPYLLERDSAMFANYGVTSPVIDAYMQTLGRFQQMQLDIAMLDGQKQSSADKQDEAKDLRLHLHHLQVKTDLAYNSKAVKYKLIDLGGTSTHTLADLRRVGEAYLQILQKRQAELTLFGLTDEDLTKLEILIASYQKSVSEQTFSRIERRIATQLRVSLANDLYDEYSRLCKLGRQMWLHTDPVKSSNYIMFDAKPPADTALEPDSDPNAEPAQTTKQTS